MLHTLIAAGHEYHGQHFRWDQPNYGWLLAGIIVGMLVGMLAKPKQH